MLAYSGKERMLLESLQLGDLVRESIRMLEVSISKKCRFECVIAENLPPILGDSSQLRQVLMNLILNASEAIGDQPGSITISVQTQFCDRGAVELASMDQPLPSGLYACLEVADTGPGMDASTLARAFDPFFTTKFVGRGLGLAVVLGIVRSHNGAITVKSEPGRGTNVRVFLPLANPTDLPERPATASAQPLSKKGTILLVDDEEMIRTIGGMMIERLGFGVLTAADGREALSVFADHRADIICVMLDLAMPHMDGAETLKALRRVQPDIRILLCSGYDEQRAASQFDNLGGIDFLQKPFQMANLAEKIRGLIGISVT
jgi:two-component system, cell cycle sensor histidine kinase and response regulator CckA